MTPATSTPAFFYTDPPGLTSSADLPVGAEFACVYAPEATVGTGWVEIRYRIVQVQHFVGRDKTRMVQPVARWALTADEAAARWVEVCEVMA